MQRSTAVVLRSLSGIANVPPLRDVDRSTEVRRSEGIIDRSAPKRPR
jgi:hypothetical protein